MSVRSKEFLMSTREANTVERIKLNLDSIAMMLFCARLKAYKEVPLTSEEWRTVEKIIKKKGLKGPASLLAMSQTELEEILEINEFVAYKMSKRIKSMNVFLSVLNTLEGNGINITTKYEDNFPKLLTKYLKKRAPLYLFYCGDINLVKEGISLMGLNKVTKKDRAYTKRLVDKAKEDDLIYISNDVKGIDDVALHYALYHGCKCVSFVCERLGAKNKDYTRYIKSGQLVMISAEDPNCYFNVTNAIDRNSYVCALSKYQIIVSSSINNGATWFTTLQNLHNKWTTPFAVEGLYLGNDRLLDMGVTPIYVKDILSDYSFDMIYEKNKKVIEDAEINIDQMSIFEFIGE